MKIEIRPIETQRWHGKKGEENFKRPIKISALINAESMEYSIALNDEEKEKLGKALKIDLNTAYNPDEPHPFYDSALGTIKLENNTMFIDASSNIGKVKIAILKASKYVANSLSEYDKGLFPEASHIIFDESEEVEVQASAAALRSKAVVKCAGLSKDRKVQLVLIISNKNLKGKSDDFVTVAIDKLINEKDKAKEILRIVDMDKEDSALQALVLEALQKSVLKKSGHKIRYHDSTLGGDVLDVVDYLKEDENQELKLRLLSAVNT